MDALKGYRTYIVGTLLGLVVALEYMGIIDQQLATAIEGGLAASGLMTLRSGIAKAAPVLIAAVGFGLLASAPASADAPPVGCNGDGCSIYFVDYEWPATVGVNAVEFFRGSFGVGVSGLSADTDVTYLGGLCLIPGVRDTPVCPSAEPEVE